LLGGTAVGTRSAGNFFLHAASVKFHGARVKMVLRK
jgi:hypothetical protein